MKIDPDAITDFNLTNARLEKTLLFWICAAGHNGHTSANGLEKLLALVRKWIRSKGIKPKRTPFAALRQKESLHKGKPGANGKWLEAAMRICGIGCYKAKAKSFMALVYSGLNLRTCSVEDLEAIPGIGPKTARCFLIHSRPNQQYAALDTHILKHLRAVGIDAPKSTPSGKKYRELELKFLELAEAAGKSPADFDLEVWKKYRIK